VGRPDVPDVKTFAAELEHAVAVDPVVGRHQLRLLVDPGGELLAAGAQALHGSIGVQVVQRGTVGRHRGPELAQGLQAVDVVGVVVRDDDMPDRLRP
jgi:hypothetical protein